MFDVQQESYCTHALTCAVHALSHTLWILGECPTIDCNCASHAIHALSHGLWIPCTLQESHFTVHWHTDQHGVSSVHSTCTSTMMFHSRHSLVPYHLTSSRSL